MKKELPSVFANPQEKKFTNNERIYYSREQNSLAQTNINEFDQDRSDEIFENKNIYQKLNEIFNSEKYVYKAEVDITTKSGHLKTKIIGQNRTHIITMDNQLIPITDLVDIKFSK